MSAAAPYPAAMREQIAAIEWAGRVKPFCIFADGRQSFEVRIHHDNLFSQQAKAVLFEHLPLAEHGWDARRARISLIGRGPGYSVWKLQRQLDPSTQGGSA